MDVNLEEGEILKFASLGNGRNLENTIDVLRRSLALRNRYVLSISNHMQDL